MSDLVKKEVEVLAPDIRPRKIKLTLRKSGDETWDWWVIERAEHEGRTWMERTGPNSMSLRDSARFSDADVEGDSHEMIAIAKAIEERGHVSFRRCSVQVISENEVLFNSPRNSQEDGVVTLADADDLAAEIRTKVRT